MGGGDLNMKKSWHPLLLKNQERVWLEEKKALEEKKKLDQLRKEKEEERQLQELQRLQEEQTGKKRTEKLEWMYTTPATGSSQNPNDREDYLLGKKRVDQILIADDNAKLGASHKDFIATQNANTARDIASKIREDPLLMMKQQEQAAYQALMSNPLRLRELQERNSVKPKKSREEKKRDKKEKRGKEKAKNIEHGARRRSFSRSPSPIYNHRRRRSPSYDHYDGNYNRRSLSPCTRRSPSPTRSLRDTRRSEYRSESLRKRRRSPSPVDDSAKYFRTSSHPSQSRTRSTHSASNYSNDRAARLAAMQTNAFTMVADRQERLRVLLEKEKKELEAENEARTKSKGIGSFLSQEQKKVFGGEGGLEDRIKRGRSGLMRDADRIGGPS